MSKISVLIIAPHVDDEMIGCWSVLMNAGYDVTVLYMYELTVERKLEAEHAATLLGFKPVFMSDIVSLVGVVVEDFKEVYVPSRRDAHQDHQQVNKRYREHATHFYSVDMAQGKLVVDRDAKLAALNECYPSQAALWQNDAKYWLFEDIRAHDYDVYTRIQIEESHTWVTVLKEHAFWVRHSWAPNVSLSYDEVSIGDVNRLLAHCSGSKVIIEGPEYRLEA